MHKELEILGVTFAVSGILFSLLGILFRLIDPIRRKNKAELFLCIMAAAMLWHVFMYFMITKSWILNLPNLYNKGIPFYYLVAPCAYLSTFYTLFPKRKLTATCWIHLLPFILAIFDVIPYAIATDQEKQDLLKLVTKDIQIGFTHSYGFIDQKWHYFIKFILAFGYLMAQWRLFYLQEEQPTASAKQNRTYAFNLTAFYSPHLLLQGSVLLSIWFNVQQGSNIIRDAKQVIWVSIFYLAFSLWLFFSLERFSPKQISSIRLWIRKK